MPGKQKSVLTAEQAQWPENLRKKYRKLALPAVVAAVAAEKGKSKRELRQRSDTDQDRRR